MNDKSHDVVRYILVGLCTGSLGFGTSQLTIVPDVRANTLEVIHLKEADNLLRAEIGQERARNDSETRQERARNDERIKQAVSLLQTVVGQNTELISLIKVQNQIQLNKQP